MKPHFLVASLVALLPLAAAEFHVSPTGLDSNAGSVALPLRTIAAASTRLNAGDVCVIHAGTYRETLRPVRSGTAASPIIYRCAGDGAVVLNAADLISGWTLAHDDIYQTAMPADLGLWENQVFVDGQMMVEARWPNLPWNAATGFDLLGAPLALASITSGSANLVVAGATQPGGFWNGARVWCEIGARWTAQTATVTASVPGSLTITGKTSPWFPDDFTFQGNQGGIYLTGLLAALDAPGEWHREAGTLSLMTPDRSNPAGHQVEVRNGRLVVDLSGRQWIIVEGVSGHAGSMYLNGSNCTVRDSTFRYIESESIAGYGGRGGINVGGTGNVLERCLVDTSSGNGVSLEGTGNTVRGCAIRNVNYMGDYSAAVYMANSQNLVEYCTLSNAGRSLVYLSGTQQRVLHNDMSNSMRLTQDGGAVYTYGTDGQGTEIAWNRVSDVLPWSVCAMTAPVEGIYLDDGSRNFIVHHNVVWNCDAGVRMNRFGSSSSLVFGNRIDHNTLISNR